MFCTASLEEAVQNGCASYEFDDPFDLDASVFTAGSAFGDDELRRRHQVRVRRITRPPGCRRPPLAETDRVGVVRPTSRRRVAAAKRQNTRPRATARTGTVSPLTAMDSTGGSATATAGLGLRSLTSSGRSPRLGRGLGVDEVDFATVGAGSRRRLFSTGARSTATGATRRTNSKSYSL